MKVYLIILLLVLGISMGVYYDYQNFKDSQPKYQTFTESDVPSDCVGIQEEGSEIIECFNYPLK